MLRCRRKLRYSFCCKYSAPPIRSISVFSSFAMCDMAPHLFIVATFDVLKSWPPMSILFQFRHFMKYSKIKIGHHFTMQILVLWRDASDQQQPSLRCGVAKMLVPSCHYPQQQQECVITTGRMMNAEADDGWLGQGGCDGTLMCRNLPPVPLLTLTYTSAYTHITPEQCTQVLINARYKLIRTTLILQNKTII